MKKLSLTILLIGFALFSIAQPIKELKFKNLSAHAVVNMMISRDSIRVNLNDVVHYNKLATMVYLIKDSDYPLSFYDHDILHVASGQFITVNNFESIFNTRIYKVYQDEYGWAFQTVEAKTDRKGKTKYHVNSMGIWMSKGGKVIIRYLPKFGKDKTQYALVFFADNEINIYTELVAVNGN